MEDGWSSTSGHLQKTLRPGGAETSRAPLDKRRVGGQREQHRQPRHDRFEGAHARLRIRHRHVHVQPTHELAVDRVPELLGHLLVALHRHDRLTAFPGERVRADRDYGGPVLAHLPCQVLPEAPELSEQFARVRADRRRRFDETLEQLRLQRRFGLQRQGGIQGRGFERIALNDEELLLDTNAERLSRAEAHDRMP